MKTREMILNAKDLHTESFEISEWGVTVKIKSLTVTQRNQLLKDASNDKGEVDSEKLYPTLLIATLVDAETEEQIFAASDRDALNGKSVGVVERVAKKIMEVCGLSNKEKLEKN